MKDKEKRRERDRRRYEDAKPAYNALISCYPFGLEDLDGEEESETRGTDGLAEIGN